MPLCSVIGLWWAWRKLWIIQKVFRMWRASEMSQAPMNTAICVLVDSQNKFGWLPLQALHITCIIYYTITQFNILTQVVKDLLLHAIQQTHGSIFMVILPFRTMTWRFCTYKQKLKPFVRWTTGFCFSDGQPFLSR